MSNTLSRRQPRLAPANIPPTLDAEAAKGFSERFELSFGLLGEALIERNMQEAARWARMLNETALRVGTWRYVAQHPRAIALWCGSEGYAARLLRLELDLVERDSEAAHIAHEILRALFADIAVREIGLAYEQEVA